MLQSIGSQSRQEDPLEKRIATHSRILAWRIPWTEELGGLQSLGSQRVGHAHFPDEETEARRRQGGACVTQLDAADSRLSWGM